MHTHTLSPALGNVVVRYAVLDGVSLGMLSEVVSVVGIVVRGTPVVSLGLTVVHTTTVVCSVVDTVVVGESVVGITGTKMEKQLK